MDYCSQLWQAEMGFIHAQFMLKRENFGSWHCLTKCALENQLLNQNWWSWYHFSLEKLPHTLIPVIASTYFGKYAVPFFRATLYTIIWLIPGVKPGCYSGMELALQFECNCVQPWMQQYPLSKKKITIRLSASIAFKIVNESEYALRW